MRRNGFVDGELVVQNGPTEDVPPDVYSFLFDGSFVNLCLYCAVSRALDGTIWTQGMGPRLEDGVCEDCGNDGGRT